MEEKLQKALVSITLKVGEAKKNLFCDQNMVANIVELLRHFKETGELKEALVSSIEKARNMTGDAVNVFKMLIKDNSKIQMIPKAEVFADEFINDIFG